MDKEIRKKNDLTLKLRCKDLLEPKEGESKPEWKKVYRELYTASYSVKLPEGKTYPVIVDLFRFPGNNNGPYCLVFSDIPQELHTQRYKPLRELGKSVFSQEKQD